MNILGFIAAAFSVALFALTYQQAVQRKVKTRLCICAGFVLLSVPSLLFASYYLHILPECAWFYELHSWRGAEFFVIFLGGAAGAAASLLPRFLLGLPLFALLALGVAPYIKPIAAPLSESSIHEQWREDACLQSTGATCGPASVSTILRQFGVSANEREAAKAAFTYAGGTEAWYLARYVRSKGLNAHFDFEKTFFPSSGLPAVVGVRIGGVGHFIAVLDVNGNQVTFADPIFGKEHVSMPDFQRRYQFTGFHMVVSRH